MKAKWFKKCWQGGIVRLLVLSLIIGIAAPGMAVPTTALGLQLFIDGKRIQASPEPIIKNDRTLVPVRLVSESLGAEVEWLEASRMVHIVKGNRSILLRIDNRLVDYQEEKATYSLCDVPPQIIEGRTYVPLRLVSNALGVGINWDGAKRTINIDSKVSTEFNPFFDMAIPSIKPGQAITGTTILHAGFTGSPPAGAYEVRFQLLDPITGRGAVIARGNNITGAYFWTPDPVHKGLRILSAAVYDQEGQLLAGTVVPVEMAVTPQVTLKGITEGQVAKDDLSLGVDLNFVAEYVKYEITNKDKGSVNLTDESDPEGPYNWAPEFTDNGQYSIRAIAYDGSGQAYFSSPINIKIDLERKLSLRGIASGTTIEKPVTLWVSRNFPVSQTEYLLRDIQTGKEEVLALVGYASYKWFPGPEREGSWDLLARVKDTVGNTHTSLPLRVQVSGTPKLLLEGVGPNQVLTGTAKLKSTANVPLSSIEYQLINTQTGAKRVIAGGAEAEKEYAWNPQSKDAGTWKIQAVGNIAAGGKVSSEAVPVKVYLGKIYEAKPVIEKSKFLDFASQLAAESRKKTGMSAALQTAQAILETGWGQSTPVDKYTGKFSNNLFGIKGQGPSGSVTSNTWEEYNGATFRIDAQFRAYLTPAQSWDDHKRLLLTASRYEPYRAVMHNSTQGAWALRRAGYATDSKYPLKLINIIKQHNLQQLDIVDI